MVLSFHPSLCIDKLAFYSKVFSFSHVVIYLFIYLHYYYEQATVHRVANSRTQLK